MGAAAVDGHELRGRLESELRAGGGGERHRHDGGASWHARPSTRCHVDGLTTRYDVDMLRELGGIVEYVVGAQPGPGVYCIAVPVPRSQLRRSTNDVAADRHDAIWSGAREAAMSVSIPEVRRTPALVAEAIDRLNTAAEEISRRLGYHDH